MVEETHVDGLLPAYVLGCLDDEDTVRVAEHLAGCRTCRQELYSYEDLMGEIAFAAPEATPSSQLKARLMQRVQPAEERPAVEQAAQPGFLDSLGGIVQRMGPAWSAISLILVLALSVSTLLLWQQIDELQRAPRGLPSIPLAGTTAAPDATGLVVVSIDGTHGTLVVDRLPVLEEEQEYQLWLIKDGTRTSGAVFSVSDDGYGSVWVSAPDPLASYTDFGVTIEPAGGSPGPTGEKVLGTTS